MTKFSEFMKDFFTGLLGPHWGMGHVIRGAGGSTGQTRSAKNWDRITKTMYERERQDRLRGK